MTKTTNKQLSWHCSYINNDIYIVPKSWYHTPVWRGSCLSGLSSPPSSLALTGWISSQRPASSTPTKCSSDQSHNGPRVNTERISSSRIKGFLPSWMRNQKYIWLSLRSWKLHLVINDALCSKVKVHIDILDFVVQHFFLLLPFTFPLKHILKTFFFSFLWCSIMDFFVQPCVALIQLWNLAFKYHNGRRKFKNGFWIWNVMTLAVSPHLFGELLFTQFVQGEELPAEHLVVTETCAGQFDPHDDGTVRDHHGDGAKLDLQVLRKLLSTGVPGVLQGREVRSKRHFYTFGYFFTFFIFVFNHLFNKRVLAQDRQQHSFRQLKTVTIKTQSQ